MAISRRTVLKGSAAVAAASSLSIPLTLPAEAQPMLAHLSPYLRLAPDGSITAVLPTTEMGQGSHTGQAMIIAEELGARLGDIRIEMPPQPAPAYRVKFGAAERMRSVGSYGIRFWHDPLRKAAAQARAVLIEAAQQRLNTEPSDLDTKDGSVINLKSGETVAFSELLAAASKLPLPQDPVLRPANQRTITGTSVPRLDIPSKVDGSAQYGVDIKLPDMLHGAVRLAPVWRADVAKFDETSARRMPGVVAVVKVPRGAVVVADSWWRAKQAADVLDITFTSTEFDQWSSEKQIKDMRAGLDADAANAVLTKGDARAIVARAQRPVEAAYEVPMLAHMCMEPIVCTAKAGNDRVDLWFPTQDHDLASEAVSQAAGVAPDRVFITTPYLGGGFGRKGHAEVAVQAVIASRAAGGRPVKVMWSREDDVRQGAYRPAMLARWRGALNPEGQIEALMLRLSGPQMGREFKHVRIQNNVDPFTVSSLIAHKYQIANQLFEHHVVDVPVPLSPWRSVSSSQNGFFLEGFVDELAHAAGQDPIAFRRAHLSGQKRHLAVLDKVAEMSKWTSKAADGMHRGVAVYESYGSVVAQVAEVSATGRNLRVQRVYVAIDCGRAINPDSVVAQMQGSVIDGLGAAWNNRVTVKNGRAEQSNFHDYPILRIDQVPPEIVVAVVDTGAPLGGVGEPGVPPIAPAVSNAIFAATGTRIRSLPISPQFA